MAQAEHENVAMRRQQELIMQRQAYEMSLATVAASAQMTLQQQAMAQVCKL